MRVAWVGIVFLFSGWFASSVRADGTIGFNFTPSVTYAGNVNGGPNPWVPSFNLEGVYRERTPKLGGELGISFEDTLALTTGYHNWFFGVAVNLIGPSGFTLGFKIDPIWLILIALRALSPTTPSSVQTFPLGFGINFGYRVGKIWPRVGFRAFNAPVPLYLAGAGVTNSILTLDLGLGISI